MEFTFVVPVLALLALGAFDFSIAIHEGMAVQAAAHAGAEYGSSEGYFYNTTSMQAYAIASQPNVPGLTAVATQVCTCTPSGTVVSCSSWCNTYDLPMNYAQVVTSATPAIFFRYSGFPITISFTGKSVRRTR